MWCAPLAPLAAGQDSTDVVQVHSEEEQHTSTPKSLVHPLYRALLSAQDKIKKLTNENDCLRRENARLTAKELSTHEAPGDLTSLCTQAKTEKENMEMGIKTMTEDLKAEREHWQEERRKHLEEISSFRMKLLVAQSHNKQMEKEVRETQEEEVKAKKEIAFLKESLSIQRDQNTAIKDHWRVVIKEREDCANKVKESEEKWQRRMNQLVEQIQDNSAVTSAIDKVITLIRGQQSSLTVLRQRQSELYQNEKRWETKSEALTEGYKKAVAENEGSWQKIQQDMEKNYNLEKMWLQKEEEWRQKTSALEEEIKQLIKENAQLQVNCLC